MPNKCRKICKSKGDSSRPQNSKHRDAADTKCAEQETCGRIIKYIGSTVEDIKTKLTKEDLFGPDIKFDDDNKYLICL